MSSLSVEPASSAANDLIHVLKHPSSATPFPSVGDEQFQALCSLAKVFTYTAFDFDPVTVPSQIVDPSICLFEPTPNPTTMHIYEPAPRVHNSIHSRLHLTST